MPRNAAILLTMAHFFANLFILMLADFFTPLFNNASHSSLLSKYEKTCPREGQNVLKVVPDFDTETTQE